MDIYETVLKLLGLSGDIDDQKAGQIRAIINLVSQRLEARISALKGETVDTVPDQLSGIVVEICVNRYNRIGSEGAASHTVDGETLTWSDDDYLAPYDDEIERYVAGQGHSVGVQFI